MGEVLGVVVLTPLHLHLRDGVLSPLLHILLLISTFSTKQIRDKITKIIVKQKYYEVATQINVTQQLC